MEKYQYFNGYKFTRDEKTGYYLNSTLRMRIHRYVWEYYNGKIPDGYHVHHIDGDKSNNNISNLTILPRSSHLKLHMSNMSEERKAALRENLDTKARPKASEWHGSKEGRAWHEKHYEEMKDKLHAKKTFKCEMCGKDFEGTDNGRNRFCSNRCKSAWRRKAGLDDIEKTCPICGRKFACNKYRKQDTCSRHCAMIHRHATK